MRKHRESVPAYKKSKGVGVGRQGACQRRMVNSFRLNGALERLENVKALLRAVHGKHKPPVVCFVRPIPRGMLHPTLGKLRNTACVVIDNMYI